MGLCLWNLGEFEHRKDSDVEISQRHLPTWHIEEDGLEAGVDRATTIQYTQVRQFSLARQNKASTRS